MRVLIVFIGPITVFNKTIFDIISKESNPPVYLHFMGWVYLWGAILHWTTAIFNGMYTTTYNLQIKLCQPQRATSSNTSLCSPATHLVSTYPGYISSMVSRSSPASLTQAIAKTECSCLSSFPCSCSSPLSCSNPSRRHYIFTVMSAAFVRTTGCRFR